MPDDNLDIAQRVRTDLDQAQRRLRDLVTGLRRIVAALTGIGSVQAVRGIAAAGVEIERLEARFRAATGSASAARAELEFTRSEARRLGIDFRAAADAYSRLAAAARGTALEGDAAREIFSATAEAAVALGLSADDTKGALMALEQIVSKDTASAEDLLPKLARELRASMGEGLADAVDGPRADFARLGNAVDELAEAFARAGLIDLFAATARVATGATDAVTEFIDQSAAERIAEIAKELSAARRGLTELPDAEAEAKRDFVGTALSTRLAAIETERRRLEADIRRLSEERFRINLEATPDPDFAFPPPAPGAVRDGASRGEGEEARREPRDRIDAELEAQRDAAEEIAAIRARAEDRLAELTLDRIALVHREEARQLQELARRRRESPALEKEITEAELAVRRAGRAEVAQINREAEEEDRRRYERAAEERARAEEDAARRAIERGREIAEAAERARREALGPLGRGLEDYARDALDAADEIQLATEQAFEGMEGALVDFVRTGELEFRRLADFVIAELARIAVQRAITGPLSAALGGLLGLGGGSFRGVSEVGGHLFFHSGGVAGAPGGSVRHGVDPRTFAGAPRFPHGGIAGDEIPAILRRGEGVFTPEQMRALGGPPNIEVRLINEGGSPQEATDDGVRWDGEKFIVTVLLRDARGNGPVTQAFRHAVSRRP